MVKWKDKTRSNSRKIYGPSFTVEGSQLFPIKIAGPAGNDVKFNLKIDSEAKIDAESDGAHHSLKKSGQRAQEVFLATFECDLRKKYKLNILPSN